MAIKLYKEGEFHAEAIRNLKVAHDNLFQEVPIVIKNSHLVNELLLELSEQIPVEVGTQFLDLGSANVLEDQLKFLMETVDELNQESIKFNKYQNMAVKQCQDKTRYLQKRQVENTARTARGNKSLINNKFCSHNTVETHKCILRIFILKINFLRRRSVAG